tara:strand:- start:4487 stop:4654 length:168 start_codon:yes stop_codon:yes gene_type:complete
MIEFLLAAGFTCTQSQEIIANIEKYGLAGDISAVHIQELIDVVKDDNPKCFKESK